jgi:multidrug efflux pump subunit AcrA (membrane-fusion protein)
MTRSGPIPPQVVEQAQRRLRETLTELREASVRLTDRDQFFVTWLGRVIDVTSADAGFIWLNVEENHWKPIYRSGPRAEIDLENDAFAADRKMHLPEAIGKGEVRAAVVNSGLEPTDDVRVATAIWFPVIVAGQVAALIELQIGVESEAAQRGCMRFLADAAESFERFYLLDDRRQREQKAAESETERKLAEALFQKLDARSAAYTLANEGRLIIGCDRLTVLIRHGRHYRVSAVSGQEVFDKRAMAIKAVETLTSRIAAVGRTTSFPEVDGVEVIGSEDYEEYVDISHTKRLSVVPLIPAPEVDPEGKVNEKPAVGAIVAEWFEASPWTPEERLHLERTAKIGTIALGAALEHDSLFLLPVWRTLGRLRKAAFEPGTKRRTYAILALATAVVAALVFYPADYTAYCRGTLQPVDRRHVFAPQDGTIRKIVIKHGQHVKKGDLLLEMRNTDLEIAAAEAAGRRTSLAEQLTGIERTLFDEGRRLTSEERSRLSGQRSELREQIASLDRQLVLYAEKRERLKVTSPLEGEVTTWGAEHLLENRPVRQGQVLLTVADTSGPWELELKVPETRSGRLFEAKSDSNQPLEVTYSPALDPGNVRRGRVTEIQNSAELRGEEGNTVLVRADIQAADIPQRRPGAEVAAHVHCGRRPLGYVWLCDVVDFLRAKVIFRWL